MDGIAAQVALARARQSDQRESVATMESMQQAIDALAEKVNRLTLALTIAQTSSAATAVGLEAIKAEHPDMALYKPTGRIYSDGSPETPIMRDHWIPAFDKIATEKGIKDPSKYRKRL